MKTEHDEEVWCIRLPYRASNLTFVGELGKPTCFAEGDWINLGVLCCRRRLHVRAGPHFLISPLEILPMICERLRYRVCRVRTSTYLCVYKVLRCQRLSLSGTLTGGFLEANGRDHI